MLYIKTPKFNIEDKWRSVLELEYDCDVSLIDVPIVGKSQVDSCQIWETSTYKEMACGEGL